MASWDEDQRMLERIVEDNQLSAEPPQPIPVGEAMMITDQNAEKLSVVNGGVTPQLGKYGTWYFVMFYDMPNEILTLEEFMEHYKFVDGESLFHLTPFTWSY